MSRRYSRQLWAPPVGRDAFQEALATVLADDPACVTIPEWWEQDFVRLVVTHQHALNAQQSPRSTLGMIDDALRLARDLRQGQRAAAKAAHEPSESALSAIFGKLAPSLKTETR